MAKIHEFNKVVCKTLVEEVIVELAPLLRKYGLSLHNRGGRFEIGKFRTKFEFHVNETKSGKSADEESVAQFASSFGLKIKHGHKFEFGGKRYTVVAIVPSKRKYPIVAMCDGKRYKFPVHLIK